MGNFQREIFMFKFDSYNTVLSQSASRIYINVLHIFLLMKVNFKSIFLAGKLPPPPHPHKEPVTKHASATLLTAKS